VKFSDTLLALAVVCLSSLLYAQSQSVPDPVGAAAGTEAPITDSPAGLQSQMDELVRLVGLPDQTALQMALDSLAMTDVRVWLSAHFPAYSVDELQQDYARAFSGYRSHVWWVMGNFAKEGNWKLKVEGGGPPSALSELGFEALLPRPDASVKVEVYRLSPSSAKPPSWVSSFVYIDGRFRFVGGTYPFWNEKLTPLRGPMAIPARAMGDVSIQGVPFAVDLNTPGIIAIVALDVSIGQGGRAHGFRLKSGDAPYVEQAKEYVRDWKFFPMATTFPMNVIFFRTKK
jgi:hypothetical protein